MAATTQSPAKVSVSGKIDAEFKPLFDLLLRKADVTADDLLEETVRAFIHQNADLLTPAERQHFKRLFAA